MRSLVNIPTGSFFRVIPHFHFLFLQLFPFLIRKILVFSQFLLQAGNLFLCILGGISTSSLFAPSGTGLVGNIVAEDSRSRPARSPET